MAKLLLFVVAAAVMCLETQAALKCHTCNEACEVAKSVEKTCGMNIGNSQEAVCTTEMPSDSKTPLMAIRKCQIVAKNTDPTCPPNSKCTYCKTDLCNSAGVAISNMALVGLVAAYFGARFLLN